jgi:MarR family 2-MHQ and catechol resistance regulon transcriptional repressor
MNITESISILDDQTENNSSSLSACIATALLGMSIVNETKRKLKDPLRKEALTMNQWLVLEMLFLKRADTASKIAIMMNTDGASITRNLDELELLGFIARNRQANDRRVIRLTLTIKGLQAAEKIFTSYAGLLHNIENRFSPNDREMWKDVKRCITSHISKPITSDLKI